MFSHKTIVTVVLGSLVGMGGCGDGPGVSGGTGGSGATGGTGGSGATGGTGGTGGTDAVRKCTNLTDFPNGVAAGDVDQSSVMLWARAEFTGTVRFEYGRDPDFVQTPDGFMEVEVEQAEPDALVPTIPSKVEITGLLAGTQYYYRACRDSCPSADAPECDTRGSFRMPHAATADENHGLRFGVSSCFRGDMRPFVGIQNVPEQDLDFFVALGDTAYADSDINHLGHDVPCEVDPAQSLEAFRCKHNAVQASTVVSSGMTPEKENRFARARASTAFFATIDDHEVVDNFAGGAKPTNPAKACATRGLDCETCAPDYPDCKYVNETDLFENALQAFEEYNPIRKERYGPGDERWAGKRKLYRYRTFGKDAALFMLDTRSFRDEAPILAYSENTMLGAAQLDELKNDLRDAETKGITWKFVLVPEPIQSLGLPGAKDRFEGYAYERGVILDFIQSECIANVVFISGDIHGGVANNLIYKRRKLERLRYSASWDISTGPVAYQPPLGPTLMGQKVDAWLTENIGSDVQLPTFQAYTGLTREEKDAKIGEVMDSILRVRGFPLTGLFLEHPHGPGLLNLGRLFPSSSKTPATLLQGSYLATNTFGWTEFDIDVATQKLTVTTYGVTPAEIAGEVPIPHPIVSQFEVAPGEAPPGCGCDPSDVCASDAACCPDNVCNGVACVGRNSLHTLAPCTRDDACESGLCSAARRCIFQRSLPAGSPCTRDVACQSGLCGAIRLCINPLANGVPCTRDVACQSGVCNLLFCVGRNSLPRFTPCNRNAACRSGNCETVALCGK